MFTGTGGEMSRRAKSKPRRETLVISVGMQKGGVAKTTNAAHLAVALGERGRRCLLWDVDENYGATKLFRAPPEAATTLDVVTGDVAVIDAVIAEPGASIELPEGVDLIPSSRRLTTLESRLGTDPFFNVNDCLTRPVAELCASGVYDYIIVDTGPSASATTRGAYMVSDYFILSIVPERLAVEGLSDALEDIGLARKPGRNPKLHLLGLILADMDRRKTLARWCEQEITRRFHQANAEPVKFRTTIGTTAGIDRASYEGKTLLQTEPGHRVSRQYRALAAEVEARIAAHQAPSGEEEVVNG